MRIYVLVEGKRTETKVYPSWFTHLLPELSRMRFPDEDTNNSYFLISGQGYPSVINELIPASVADVNKNGNYNYLMVSLDADEVSPKDRVNEINEFLVEQKLYLKKAELIIVVQHKCIETWFLGNRRIISSAPTSQTLRNYIDFYDVGENDPEMMSKYKDFSTHAQFHFNYLQEIFREKNISYSKANPGHVRDVSYLEQLVERIKQKPMHLTSLQVFINFCEKVKYEIAKGL